MLDTVVKKDRGENPLATKRTSCGGQGVAGRFAILFVVRKPRMLSFCNIQRNINEITGAQAENGTRRTPRHGLTECNNSFNAKERNISHQSRTETGNFSPEISSEMLESGASPFTLADPRLVLRTTRGRDPFNLTIEASAAAQPA